MLSTMGTIQIQSDLNYEYNEEGLTPQCGTDMLIILQLWELANSKQALCPKL